MNERELLARGWAEALQDGAVSVPYALLRTYRTLGLSDTEAMLLIQLMAFRQLEQNEFPTTEQLCERLGATPAAIGEALQRLIKLGLLGIDEYTDPGTGVLAERFTLTGLFNRIGELLASGGRLRAADSAKTPPDGSVPPAVRTPADEGAGRVFRAFEQEFGRPLTPMECETIEAWLDQDGYPEELVLFALKEAVFAGKLHFRYIDRILLEWSRNRVTSVEEARSHVQKFRPGR
ncbi:MAG: DNA replication protein DnaD [Paenibacillaceae bacterium ZCTH02-B3]|nr:MAG: DNA replication protein DnaD [Paenibacillaceae bacterium ZCTH02-B3]